MCTLRSTTYPIHGLNEPGAGKSCCTVIVPTHLEAEIIVREKKSQECRYLVYHGFYRTFVWNKKVAELNTQQLSSYSFFIAKVHFTVSTFATFSFRTNCLTSYKFQVFPNVTSKFLRSKRANGITLYLHKFSTHLLLISDSLIRSIRNLFCLRSTFFLLVAITFLLSDSHVQVSS